MTDERCGDCCFVGRGLRSGLAVEPLVREELQARAYRARLRGRGGSAAELEEAVLERTCSEHRMYAAMLLARVFLPEARRAA